MAWEGVDWSQMAQFRDKWQPVVNVIMNIWVPYNVDNFLTS